jgi:hypothetical protein
MLELASAMHSISKDVASLASNAFWAPCAPRNHRCRVADTGGDIQNISEIGNTSAALAKLVVELGGAVARFSSVKKKASAATQSAGSWAIQARLPGDRAFADRQEAW